MRWLDGSSVERRERLVTLLTVLGALLIVLALIALLGAVLELLSRFRQPILLFVGGALLAYLMAPLVATLQRVLHSRAASIAAAYIVLFVSLVLLGVLLVNPFISQARSLSTQLHSPSAASLASLSALQGQAAVIRRELGVQQGLLASGQSVPPDSVQRVRSDIATFSGEFGGLTAGPIPPGETQTPPSYVKSMSAPLAQLRTDYSRYQSSTELVDLTDMSHAVRDAGDLVSATRIAHDKVASSPILLLNLQVWLDRRGLPVDLHEKFGSALHQVSNQLAGIVNNAVAVALQAGGLLLNTVIILIISVYFLSDGARFVRWCVALSPQSMEGQAEYFVSSFNSILGAYLRTQILMALLAAVLAAVGALVLGVPYAIVIFVTVFVLSLVPVIGPLILPIPPMLIAVIFTSLPAPVLYLAWLLIGEQLVTNVIGPRVQGHSVGIHPLEAMAAALIGFPIAGFLGSFFAVPMVAFLHVVVGSVAHARRELRSARGGSPSQTTAAVPLVETAGKR
jgi:predicted PurR-regulated permease PerM